MKHLTFIFILTGSLSYSSAWAEDVSYSYLETNIVSTTGDLGDSTKEVDGNGFGFSLSLDINPNFAFTLSVISTTFKTFQGIEVDESKMTDLGITAHKTIAPATDIFANLSATKAEVRVPDGDTLITDNDYGTVFEIGVRHKGRNGLGLELDVSNTEVFDTATISYTLTARLYFRKVYSAGFGYVSSKNADSFLFNVRMDI